MTTQGLTKETIDYNTGMQKERLKTLSDRQEDLWIYRKMCIAFNPNGIDFKSEKMNFSKNFTYPGKIYINENGNRVSEATSLFPIGFLSIP